MVATDIAARGIDIDELTHVINYELPNVPESYVHRIGRTGRAGASGITFGFCDAEEKEYLKDIEKLIGKKVPIVEDHPFPLKNHTVKAKAPPKPQRPPRAHRQESSGEKPHQTSRGHREESTEKTHSSLRPHREASPKKSHRPAGKNSFRR